MILLSDTPAIVFKMLLKRQTVKTWVYLGQRTDVLERIRSCVGPQAKQLDYAKLLYEMSDQYRSSFVQWIDQIAKHGDQSPEWFFSTPSVKNPANSTLFLQVCYFFVLKELTAQNSIDIVVVDSKALRNRIGKYFPSFRLLNVLFLWDLMDSFKAFIRVLGRFFLYIPRLIAQFLTARRILKNRVQKFLHQKKNIVFIRNYINGQFSDESDEVLEKRYFPGLYRYLESQGKTPVFLPVAIQTDNYIQLFSRVSKSSLRILFVEELLKWGDYLFMALAPLRALFYKIKAPFLDGFDLKSLVSEEYLRNITEHGFLLSVLFSRFGKRLREQNVIPESIVNWSEYQTFEKGLIAGLRQNFPGIKIIAAHSFCIPPNHLCLVPSLQEKLLNILPDRSLTLGNLGKEIVSEYLKDIPVAYSPLFRYQAVFQDTTYNPQANDVLVLFGFSFSNAVHTLKTLCELEGSLNSVRRVLIKLHPLSNFDSKALAAAVGKSLPDRFEFIEGRLDEHLANVAIGICGATGTAVELVVRGIPVIIAAETMALTMNYLAYRQDPNLWKICYDSADFDEALRFFLNLRQNNPGQIHKAARQYSEAYFASPSSDYFSNII